MALMQILTYPDPFLKKRVSEVERVDGEIRRILADMAETMYAAPGVGLAATQVGVDKRLIVVDFPKEEDEEEGAGWAYLPDGTRLTGLLSLVNPEICESSEQEITWEEGCLSIPGVYEEVKRPGGVKVRALDEQGNSLEIEAVGLPAVALQHEIDHLNGVLFIDRLPPVKKKLVKKRIKKALAEGTYPPKPGDKR